MSQSLRNILAELYLHPDSIRRVLDDATIDPRFIPLTGPSSNIWTSVLIQARAQRKMRLLLNVVQSDYPENQELREAIEDMVSFRSDGYVVYESPELERNGYRDAIHRIDAQLTRLDAEIDKLREAMLIGDASNLKEIRDYKHQWNEIWQPFILEYQLFKSEVGTLKGKLQNSESKIQELSDVNRRMLWFGLVTGLTAVAGQFILLMAFDWLKVGG